MSITPFSINTNKMNTLRTADLNTNKIDLSSSSISNNNNTNRSITNNDSYDSTYFIPNYPFKEPLFYVPHVPNIIKVPEPKVPKRPPPPGYDMRTLRKQVEHLTEEIHEKQEVQSLLYHQNEQLWKYIQDLLESNKANAHIMRNEVMKLHIELKNVHRERYQMVEKLQMIKNSKKMLEDLTKELQESQTTVEETEKRKAEAEHALQSAISENAQLEQALHSQVERMQGVHDELDSYRKQKAEEIAIDVADEFFYTNKTVLRAAYFRFRSSVQARFRLSKIYSVILSTYRHHLRQMCWQSWRFFIKKRRFMHKSIQRRRSEKLLMCVALWKLHTALEVMFKKAHRRLIFKKIFTAWKTITKEVKYEQWALEVTEQLHIMQHKRKVFLHWKQNTIFLDWNNAVLLYAEGIAKEHYLRTLFKCWFRIAMQERYELNDLATVVPRIVQWHHFRVWHALCGSQWRRRGRLLRRFFRRIRYMVEERAENAVTHKYAMTIWVGIQQRKALRTWSRFVRIRRMFVTGAHLQDRLLLSPNPQLKSSASEFPPSGSFTPNAFSPSYHRGHSTQVLNGKSNSSCKPISLKIATSSVTYNSINRWQWSQSVQVLSHMKRRWLRNSFLVMIYFTSVCRRQQICKLAGTQHYIVGLASKAVDHWHKYSKNQIKIRNKYQKWILNKIMQGWKDHILELKRERKQQEGLALLEAKVHNRYQVSLIRRWHAHICNEKRQRHLISFLQWKQTRGHQRRYFNAWRGLWGSLVYWKVKEMQIEYIRVRQLNDLKESSIEELEAENKKNIAATRQLEDTLVSLQEAIADQNNIVRQQVLMIASKEDEKRLIQNRLEESKLQLKDLSDEKRRMMEFEAVLQAEIHQQEVEKEQLRLIAAEVVKRVENETVELQLEVHTAREQALLAEKIAERELAKKHEEMQLVKQEALQLQEELNLKKLELEVLTTEQQGLMEGLEKVQGKLIQANADGLALIEENEASIRSKTGAVRVLRANAGLAAARVSALHDLVNEHQFDQERVKLNEILENEQLEIQELQAMQEKLRLELKVIDGSESGSVNSEAIEYLLQQHNGSGLHGRSGDRSKGVSLYKNTLTPSQSSLYDTASHRNEWQRASAPNGDTQQYDILNTRHSYSEGTYMKPNIDAEDYYKNINIPSKASTITFPYNSVISSSHSYSHNPIADDVAPHSSALNGSVLDLISSPSTYVASSAGNHSSLSARSNLQRNSNTSVQPLEVTNHLPLPPTGLSSSSSSFGVKPKLIHSPHPNKLLHSKSTSGSGRYNNNSNNSSKNQLHRITPLEVKVSPAKKQASPSGSGSAIIMSPGTKQQTSPNSSAGVRTAKPSLTFLTAMNSLSDQYSSSTYKDDSSNSNNYNDNDTADHDIESIELDRKKLPPYRYDNAASDISVSDKDEIA